MNHWLANSVKNLLPLSKSSEFQEALSEWFFTGEVDDYEGEEADIVCELCEHPDLLTHYHIRNAHTGGSLLVGSSCILKFQQIVVRDDHGELILDATLRRRALESALRAKNIDTSLKPLRRLWKLDSTRRKELEFLAGEIKSGLGLSPRQLCDLLRYFDESDIPYSAKLYKVRVRSYELASGLAYMSASDFTRIAPALSPSQLKRVLNRRNEA